MFMLRKKLQHKFVAQRMCLSFEITVISYDILLQVRIIKIHLIKSLNEIYDSYNFEQATEESILQTDWLTWRVLC
jgi:hypothetical protein